MGEPATDNGGKYYVFYYDVERKVELAARFPSSHNHQKSYVKPPQLEIRAKITNRDGVPCVYHYNYNKRWKPSSFRESNPIRWKEKIEVLDTESKRVTIQSRTINPANVSAAELRAKKLSGEIYAETIKGWPHIKLITPKGKAISCKLADKEQQSIIQDCLNDIEHLHPGFRQDLFRETKKLLKCKETHTAQELQKAKEAPEEEKPRSHALQELIGGIEQKYSPNVYVKKRNGIIETLTFQDYSKNFYVAEEQAPRRKLIEATLEQADKQDMDRAMAKHGSPVRVIRDPNSLDPILDCADEVPKTFAKQNNPDFRYTCQDALFTTVQVGNKTTSREADHYQLLLSSDRMVKCGIPTKTQNEKFRLGSDYEVWILKQTPPPALPVFFIIHRNKKGTITEAARFGFDREDKTGSPIAVLKPYNDDYLDGKPPITHLSHPMYKHNKPEILSQAEIIAQEFSEDVLACWNEEIKSLDTHNWLPKNPDYKIANAIPYGSIAANAANIQAVRA